MAVESGGWPWIGAAGVMCVVFMALSQIRYWVLLRSAGVLAGPGKVIQVGFISWFFNAALIGGLGFLSDDAIRIGYLMRKSDRRAAIFGATLIDRVVGVMGIITMAVFALQIGWGETVDSPVLRQAVATIYTVFAVSGLTVLLSVVSLSKQRTASMIAWIILAGVATAFMPRIYESWFVHVVLLLVPLACAMMAPSFLPGSTLHNFVVNRLWMGDRVGAFIAALLEYRNRTWTLLATYVVSLVIQACALVVLILIARGISIEHKPSMRQIWFATPPVSALSILPLPASGLGVGEAAFDTMLSFCAAPDGSPLQGGAALFLSYRILMSLMALTGLPFYLATPRKPATTLDRGILRIAPEGVNAPRYPQDDNEEKALSCLLKNRGSPE